MENQFCHRCGREITKENESPWGLVQVYTGDNLVQQVEMCHDCQEALLAYLEWESNEEA